ncbi:hypothetical protein KRX51_06960 [Corynebacterium sp. TAE3-ERU12]|uniref:hypothetical protein n=1 Tax=Corynebacterium sp. TAE3-ERU12 TaxID=2849491 RepID=UPI001C4556E1|nr:hypothetical protein [Corynebacterium sp. TAE3-ERU12]MBV7295654.1 hypothetical protein [Corynebacterium sp. TAE3-ERU12]
MPGIMTPNTLVDRESWIVAHKATATGFMLLAVFFTLVGVAAIAALFYLSEYSRVVFGGGFLVAMLLFGVLIIIGDRAAANFQKRR